MLLKKDMSFIELETKNIPLNMTPSRKRKRETEKQTAAAPDSVATITKTTTTTSKCFTNAGFSSTPKKLIGKRRKAAIDNNKNINNNNVYARNAYLEVKSIEQIVENKKEDKKIQEPPLNPYEVVRKPPKKKKRQAVIEEACFENPALNLEIPDKQFNPYEVMRSENAAVTPAKPQGFVNAALNIRGQDVSAARNPYEIPRDVTTVASKAATAGVKNLVLEKADSAAVPCGLKIGLPFTPTLGCRIDFQNMSLLQLTPSKLLAEKLVFSPVPPPKRSLDSIGEESSKDISKELDRYQLELENSINEAKLRKNGISIEEKIQVSKVDGKLDMEPKLTFSQKLENIVEAPEEAELEEECENIESTTKENIQVQINIEKSTICSKPKEQISVENFSETYVVDDEVVFESEEDEVYDDDDELDFKAPAPFVRAYRRADAPRKVAELCESKESLDSQKSKKSTENVEQKKTHLNVTNLIRKSIRKLMHKNEPYTDFHYNDVEIHEEPKEEKKQNGIMTSIRHSLRRNKQAKQPLITPEAKLDDENKFSNENTKVSNMSIMDTSERKMKLKSNLPQNEYAKIEELTTEKKHTLRHSLRRSTRGFGQQLMKNVFHKEHEKYAFNK